MAGLENSYRANLQAFGQGGFAVYGAGQSGVLTNEYWIAISALEDSEITVTPETGFGSVSTFTLPKGMTFYGRLVSVAVTSGNVIAYKEAIK